MKENIQSGYGVGIDTRTVLSDSMGHVTFSSRWLSSFKVTPEVQLVMNSTLSSLSIWDRKAPRAVRMPVLWLPTM